MSDPIVKALRRETDAALNRGGMQVGLPKAHVDAGTLNAMLDRYEAAQSRVERLEAALREVYVMGQFSNAGNNIRDYLLREFGEVSHE